MNQELTIEQLKFAREIGATFCVNNPYFDGDGFFGKEGFVYRGGEWMPWIQSGDCTDTVARKSGRFVIDFTQLDEYYADKDADIRATGGDDIPAILKPQTGAVDADTHCEEVKPKVEWVRDDETGGLKPLPIRNAKPDMVNNPPHYQSDSGIECIDAIRAALGKEGFIAYCRGNAMKYTWRDKLDNAEDWKKAAWYLNKAAEEMSK